MLARHLLHPAPGARIILIRHGRPAIALRKRTSYREFHDYIDAYEAAGLDLLLLQMSPQLEEMERFAAEVIAVAS